MVTRGAYYEEDEQSFRRYSNRGHGYPLSHDRELPPAPHHGPYARSQHMVSQSSRQSPEQDNNAQPRRRIPVACGRCRKRKIRCSGDPGNGQPCSSCKSAGNDSCQFLRVSSTEAQMKSEGADFGYDSATAVSRIHCRMSPYGPQHQPYTPHVTSLGPDGYPYRNNSLTSYQMPVKYYNIPPYSEFGDEGVDYGMPASNYSIMAQEPLGIPYNSSGSIRWTQGPQVQKSNSLFVEQESSYNHGQLPYHPNSFPIRSNISPESKGLSLNGMSTALPAPVNGTDRLLPFPASNRPAQMGPYLRSTESLLPMSQSSMQFGNSGLMSAGMLNAVKALNASAISENASMSANYVPLSSSPDSLPSSQMSFGTQSVTSSQQNHDVYASSHENPQHSLFQHNNSSSNDMSSYGPSSSGSHRPSVSSQTNDDDSQTLQSSNGGGTLANGHYYQPPPPSSQASYAAPPIVDRHEPVPMPLQARLHSVSAT